MLISVTIHKYQNNFMLLTATYEYKKYNEISVLRFHGNNGYAKAPEVLRSVDISCPII